jgi:hypothetical protein
MQNLLSTGQTFSDNFLRARVQLIVDLPRLPGLLLFDRKLILLKVAPWGFGVAIGIYH